MSDPLSIAGGVISVLSFAISAARGLHDLIKDIKDAPRDITDLTSDLMDLTMLLDTAQTLCQTERYKQEEDILDRTINETLKSCANHCQSCIRELKTELAPLVNTTRFSPFRALVWLRIKSSVEKLKTRLDARKATFQLSLMVLSRHLDGKSADEIKQEIAAGSRKLEDHFLHIQTIPQFRRRLEIDIETLADGISGPTLSGLSEIGEDQNITKYFETMEAEPPVTVAPTTPILGSIMEAIRSGSLERLEVLVRLGAPLSERSAEGMTALHHCAIYNQPELAKVLVENHADLNAKSNDLKTPLQIAVKAGSTNVAMLLIQKGATLRGLRGRDISGLLTQEEDEKTAGLLAVALSERLKGSKKFFYLVQCAIIEGKPEQLSLLLKAGFDPNEKDNHGLPPIFVAVLKRRYRCVKILKEHGADLDMIFPDTDTNLLDRSLHWQRLLVREGASSPLVAAGLLSEPIEMVTLLLSLGVDVNMRFPKVGDSPLNCFCAGNFLPVATVLIEQGGADVNLADYSGHSPMHWAVICEHPELLTLLLKKGGNVHAKTNENGSTPLFFAAEGENEECVKLLIEAGADPLLPTEDGRTPLGVARERGNEAIIEMMENGVRAKGDAAEQKPDKLDIKLAEIGENEQKMSKRQVPRLGNRREGTW